MSRGPLLTAIAAGLALALWANLPEHDPWSEVPPGQPHPRIGAQVTLAPRVFADLPPLELSPRRSETPDHWRSALAGLRDAELDRALPSPDQEAAGPEGRVHRFWHSWCPRGDGDEARWVAHLWVASAGGRVVAVHLVGGGGVLIGEAAAPVADPPPGVPR